MKEFSALEVSMDFRENYTFFPIDFVKFLEDFPFFLSFSSTVQFKRYRTLFIFN
jgi:hypothetical protein